MGSQKIMNALFRIIIGYQRRDRQTSQNMNNDTCCRFPVTSCHCIIGTEKYLESGILLYYDDNDYTRGYG